MSKSDTITKKDQPKSATTPADGIDKTKDTDIVVDNLDKDDSIVAGKAGDEPVTVIMKPPRRHKASVIVAIFALLLLVIGGGCLAAWYFCVYSSPSVVAYDAVRQFLTADNVVTDGSIRLAQPVQAGSDSQTVAELKFDSSSVSLPNSTHLTLNISQLDQDGQTIDGHSLSLDLGLAVMSDGVLYFHVDHLLETVDRLLQESGFALTDLGNIAEFVYEVISVVDGEWWQISINDILNEQVISQQIARPAESFYHCLLRLDGGRAQAAELYNTNRFILLERTQDTATNRGDSRYRLSLDLTALANYLNAIPETAVAQQAFACYNDFADQVGLETVSVRDIPELSATELSELLDQFQASVGSYTTYLEISDASHRLNHLEMTASNDKLDMVANLNFRYEAVTVTPPAGYRPLTDLFSELSDLIEEYFGVAPAALLSPIGVIE